MARSTSALKASHNNVCRRKTARKTVGRFSVDLYKGLCPDKQLALFITSSKLYCAVLRLPAQKMKRKSRQKRFPQHNRRRAIRSNKTIKP